MFESGLYMKKILTWIHNGRTTALPQSLTPAILAAVMAAGSGFCWWTALLSIVGVVFAHLALNLTDDYFDYKVDMKGDRDSVIRRGFRAMSVKYPFLTDGSATLKDTFKAISQMTVVAIACGTACFIRMTSANGFIGSEASCGSWWIVAIVFATAFLGYFYSAPPFKLGYRGLGELVIGLIFGPLLMMGVFYASCGRMTLDIIFISVPVGLLVMNILFVHSIIDLPADTESNKMTFARVLGRDKANLTAEFLIISIPFLLVLAAVVTGFLHPAFLIVFLMLPRAVWLFRSIRKFLKGEETDTSRPAWYLGQMQNWKPICDAGIDWFMIRWFTARNLLSGFCLCCAAAKIFTIFI